jgi:hypothetical protein
MAENPPAFVSEEVDQGSREARYALSERLAVAPMMDWIAFDNFFMVINRLKMRVYFA